MQCIWKLILNLFNYHHSVVLPPELPTPAQLCKLPPTKLPPLCRLPPELPTPAQLCKLPPTKLPPLCRLPPELPTPAQLCKLPPTKLSPLRRLPLTNTIANTVYYRNPPPLCTYTSDDSILQVRKIY